MKLLDNYRQLVKKVDALCRTIEERHASHLACRKGCDDCCRHLSLFRVEAVALAKALDDVPEPERSRIRQRARKATVDGPCPLLDQGRCLLYEARPIICRTHGLPILTDENRLDFCPRNFRDVVSLPGESIVKIERLNTALAGIDALFIEELFAGQPSNRLDSIRLTIAEALLLPSWEM